MSIIFDNLSSKQTQIVKTICYAQLNSLRRIYNNKHHSEQEIINLLIEYEVSEDQLKDELENRLDAFKKLSNNPNDISKLRPHDLSAFKHLLANIEKEFKEKYPKAVSNLWERLFIIDDIRNPTDLN